MLKASLSIYTLTHISHAGRACCTLTHATSCTQAPTLREPWAPPRNAALLDPRAVECQPVSHQPVACGVCAREREEGMRDDSEIYHL